jgi:hypothetical protein
MGSQIGTSTVCRQVREALALLAAMTSILEQAIEVTRGKTFVILDCTGQGTDRPLLLQVEVASGLVYSNDDRLASGLRRAS